MNNYMPLFYADVITYARPNIDVALAKLCQCKRLSVPGSPGV